MSEGVILYGNDAKAREAMDDILLRRFDGRVLIKEQDPEDSFIDLVQIRATSPDGSEKLLYPKNEKLRFADGHYLKLKKGEEVTVEFEWPPGFVARKYVLVASGYYLPYSTKPSKSSPSEVWNRRMRRFRSDANR